VGLNKRQRDCYWPQLIERDGTDLCIRCGNSGRDIHHVNGDDTDNRIENMCILCHACNKLKKLQKKNLPVSRRDYTPEHKKNIVKEPKFKKWLQGKMFEKNYHYPLDFVIDEGAWHCNVSTETIKRYLSKICGHPSAPYTIESGQNGEMEVWLIGHQPSLNQ
jgi:hypothetical protein